MIVMIWVIGLEYTVMALYQTSAINFAVDFPEFHNCHSVTHNNSYLTVKLTENSFLGSC